MHYLKFSNDFDFYVAYILKESSIIIATMLLKTRSGGFCLLSLMPFLFLGILPSPLDQRPQRSPYQWATFVNRNNNTTPNLSPRTISSLASGTVKTVPKYTESYLPAVMQALAYYVELIQYEPLHTTTIEPPFKLDPFTTTHEIPSYATSTTSKPIQSSTWWSPTSTVRPTTTTIKPWTTSYSTRRPSSTTPSWWNYQTTPFHKPGYYAPENPSNPLTQNINNKPINDEIPFVAKPTNRPQFGDLSVLSIVNQPYFDYFVSKPKTFIKKPEYQYLHGLPAELLQDVENEPYELAMGSDLEVINEFLRVYDDFYTRIRVFSPITGKKRVPPTRPYVLFLMLYDLCKREAKRLSLHDFEGYSTSMLERLNKTSEYSAERQFYTLLFELLEQKTIVANDFITRAIEIMTDLSNPDSQTAKALRVLPALTFKI